MGQTGLGRVSAWFGCGISALALAGCGGSDGTDESSSPMPKMGTATPDCGTVQQPLLLTLSNLQPMLGSSVPNVDIVQSFTIVGRHLRVPPAFSLPAAHTAGRPSPEPVTWTLSASGEDTVYTALPVVWQTAPSHVELDPPGLLVTQDGCVSSLPSPTLSYDVTAL